MESEPRTGASASGPQETALRRGRWWALWSDDMRNRRKGGTSLKVSLRSKSTYSTSRPSGIREVGVNTATFERSGGGTVPPEGNQASRRAGEGRECRGWST